MYGNTPSARKVTQPSHCAHLNFRSSRQESFRSEDLPFRDADTPGRETGDPAFPAPKEIQTLPLGPGKFVLAWPKPAVFTQASRAYSSAKAARGEDARGRLITGTVARRLATCPLLANTR